MRNLKIRRGFGGKRCDLGWNSLGPAINGTRILPIMKRRMAQSMGMGGWRHFDSRQWHQSTFWAIFVLIRWQWRTLWSQISINWQQNCWGKLPIGNHSKWKFIMKCSHLRTNIWLFCHQQFEMCSFHCYAWQPLHSFSFQAFHPPWYIFTLNG